MAKQLIVIHGRDIKPAEKPMREMTFKAIVEGLRRAGMNKQAEKVETGDVELHLAYFGDISNEILAELKVGDAEKLTETDQKGRKVFPISNIENAFELTKSYERFDETQYDKILSEADDWRFLDEAADFASIIGALFTFGALNNTIIKTATPDLSQYLMSHNVGSNIRLRLQKKLEPALRGKADVCLVAHSMGCMVAYDLLWKFAHMSEYSRLRKSGGKVSRFVTLGCPLGELGVRSNLLDARYPEEDRYPAHMIGEWLNFYAEDDYIAREEKMSVAFKKMKGKIAKPIEDRHLYNCWVYRDKRTGRLTSNPHDYYGYLMHQDVGRALGGWIG